MGLELMELLNNKVNVSKYFGICPTVMNIAQSTKGLIVTPLLGNNLLRTTVFHLFHFLQHLISFLPEKKLYQIAKSIMSRDCPDVENYYLQHGISLIDPFLVENVIHMANEEMFMILGEEDRCIKHAIKYHDSADFVFIFSPIDKWCDKNIQEHMRKTFKNSKFQVLSENVTHVSCFY